MAHTRQMRLGFSIGSIGYHYAAWRLPEASPDSGLSGRHYIESAQLAEQGKFGFVFVVYVMSIRNFDDQRIAQGTRACAAQAGTDLGLGRDCRDERADRSDPQRLDDL
jgi:hypothetical protein